MHLKYFIQYLVRLFYYKLRLNKLYNPFKRKPKDHYKLTIEDIKSALDTFNINLGDSIMVHSSMSFLDGKPEDIIDLLKKRIGTNGNVLMPTHPRLTKENDSVIYDVSQSKSTVGYLTEAFRKSSDTKRSQHPFSSIAALGKDKEYFLENNLNLNSPLPHGIDSPYYKFAQQGGKAIFLGVTTRRATIMHTPDEVMDADFNIPNFFKAHQVIVKDNGKLIGDYNVRVADLEIAKLYISKSKVLKDWSDNGILKTIYFNGIPISCVLCNEAVDLMLSEMRKGVSYYPCAPKKKVKLK
jgi:aminoglycoside 3-N-acetyltransferase